jgi:hypothetical protein
MLDAVSCKKNHCYHCYAFLGYLAASKSGDSVYVAGVISRIWLQDSVNYYKNFGYKIDTVIETYYDDPLSGSMVCDTNSVYYGQPIRDSCIIVI